jgi:multiple sugar transport system permease protein
VLTRPAARRTVRRGGASAYLFMLPAALFYLAFIALPIGYTVWLSMRALHVSGLGLGGAPHEVFVGAANYRGVLTDSDLWTSLARVLAYGAIVLPVMLGLAVVFALLLDAQRIGLRRFGRIAIFLPFAVPGVIATLLWGFLYLPATSPIQWVSNHTALPAIPFLSGGGVLFSVANIAIWGGVGFNMLVLYTALQAIPTEQHDAARIDGAGELQIALRVKLPQLVPALILTTIFSIVATLQLYTEPTTLRPLTNAITYDWTPLMAVYRDAFILNDVYHAAALSVVLALAALIASFGFLRAVQRRAFSEDTG